jgi:zinc transport system substrate-binding protein
MRRTISGFKRLLVIGTMVGVVASAAVAGQGQDDLKVVVTIKPIHSLVTQLMDGVGTPTLLIEGAATPHSFALKPSAIRAVNDADVFVRVSETLEPFTGKIVRALPDDVELVTLADAAGLKLLDRRTSSTFEADDEHGAHAHADETGAGGKDGHIWLDPANAKVIVAHLAKVLQAHAPHAAERIDANASALIARIDALDAELAAKTKPLKGRPYIVFHDALHYFGARYGLDAIGAISVSPEVQPSAKRLTELRAKIRALGPVCVFAEPLFQPNLVAAVTEGTEARAGTLDPLGAMLAPGAEHYFLLMRNLAVGLRSCLESSM